MADNGGGEQDILPQGETNSSQSKRYKYRGREIKTIRSNMETLGLVIVLIGLESNCEYLQQMCVSESQRWKWFQLKDFFSCFQLLAAVIWNKRELAEVQAVGAFKRPRQIWCRSVAAVSPGAGPQLLWIANFGSFVAWKFSFSRFIF